MKKHHPTPKLMAFWLMPKMSSHCLTRITIWLYPTSVSWDFYKLDCFPLWCIIISTLVKRESLFYKNNKSHYIVIEIALPGRWRHRKAVQYNTTELKLPQRNKRQQHLEVFLKAFFLQGIWKCTWQEHLFTIKIMDLRSFFQRPPKGGLHFFFIFFFIYCQVV